MATVDRERDSLKKKTPHLTLVHPHRYRRCRYLCQQQSFRNLILSATTGKTVHDKMDCSHIHSLLPQLGRLLISAPHSTATPPVTKADRCASCCSCHSCCLGHLSAGVPAMPITTRCELAQGTQGVKAAWWVCKDETVARIRQKQLESQYFRRWQEMLHHFIRLFFFF